MVSPQLVVLAGPNGAGKTTFYQTFLAGAGLPFVNADAIAQALNIDAGDAAKCADAARAAMLESRQSFITETVFSDPVGAKLEFLRHAIFVGYQAELVFIGIASANLSEARVIQRVSHGGHDVPSDRLERRYKQSLQNLAAAITFMPSVRVFDNSDVDHPYRLVLHTQNGTVIHRCSPFPPWLEAVGL